jgi:hypothetical protein
MEYGQQVLWRLGDTVVLLVSDNAKIIARKPIQEHINVLNVSLSIYDALGTGGFGQERPSLDLRKDENGGCNDRN